jgi:hypothetical protein
MERKSLPAFASYERDPRVDHYVDALPEWQQAICRQVRDLVHAADPEVQETIKRSPSMTVRRSTPRRFARCSSRSSRTTAPADGGS